MPDYDYYRTVYLGQDIPQCEFDRLALRASEYVDSMVAVDQRGTDNYMKAVCAVAEAWRTNESGGELQSQTVGSWSRTYATTGKSGERRLYDAARRYIPLVRWC